VVFCEGKYTHCFQSHQWKAIMRFLNTVVISACTSNYTKLQEIPNMQINIKSRIKRKLLYSIQCCCASLFNSLGANNAAYYEQMVMGGHLLFIFVCKRQEWLGSRSIWASLLSNKRGISPTCLTHRVRLLKRSVISS